MDSKAAARLLSFAKAVHGVTQAEIKIARMQAEWVSVKRTQFEIGAWDDLIEAEKLADRLVQRCQHILRIVDAIERKD